MLEGIIIVFLAAVVGLLIVDYRLSDISINMPTVKLPEITVNIAGDKYEVKLGSAEPQIRQQQVGGNRGSNCHYYLDPKAMNSKQLEIFRTKAKVEHMTAGDYHNWLSVRRDRVKA